MVPILSYHQEQPSDTRTIVLSDLLGSEIRLVLWGNHANEFPADEVLPASVKAAVIAIFVGTLPKMLKGVLVLSGGAACLWCINEDLPDINSFHDSLGPEFVLLAAYAPPEQGSLSNVHEDSVEKTVKELLDIDPFENLVLFFMVHSTDAWTPNVLLLKYCICTMASDDSDEAEFMIFDTVVRGLIGNALINLLQLWYPGFTSVRHLAQMGGADVPLPPAIGWIVTQKFKLVASIFNKSFTAMNGKLSFQVVRIIETYKPELGPIGFGAGSINDGASSSSPGSRQRVPALMPFAPVAPFTPLLHDVHGKSLLLGAQSPDWQVFTPPSDMEKAPKVPPSGKLPCPRSTARH